MSEKLTPWFPGDVKPVYPGPYQQKCGFGRDIGYQFWDGNTWFSWRRTINQAMKEYEAGYKSCTQNDPWRGLTKVSK